VTTALLSLGSNLGDRFAHLCAAVKALDDALLVVSGVYETAPWGDPDQPAYLNAAILVVSDSDEPHHWIERARALEAAAGRVRDPDRPYGPRTLDVDVIAVWGADGEPVVSTDPELTLPHPRAHQRAFVLRPWIDIQPYAHLPGHGPLTDLLRSADLRGQVAQLRARPDLQWEA